MKRLFCIIFSLLLLVGCGRQELPAVTEEDKPVPAPTETAPAAPVPEAEEAVPETEEETPTEQPARYDTETVEGLVEDTVGYIFQVPSFGVPAKDTIRQYYLDMADYLVDYTKEAVYPAAAEQGCIANVMGTVTSAKFVGEDLQVEYLFTCDFSGSSETQENPRTDVFNVFTGEKIG